MRKINFRVIFAVDLEASLKKKLNRGFFFETSNKKDTFAR